MDPLFKLDLGQLTFTMPTILYNCSLTCEHRMQHHDSLKKEELSFKTILQGQNCFQHVLGLKDRDNVMWREILLSFCFLEKKKTTNFEGYLQGDLRVSCVCHTAISVSGGEYSLLKNLTNISGCPLITCAINCLIIHEPHEET